MEYKRHFHSCISSAYAFQYASWIMERSFQNIRCTGNVLCTFDSFTNFESLWVSAPRVHANCECLGYFRSYHAKLQHSTMSLSGSQNACEWQRNIGDAEANSTEVVPLLCLEASVAVHDTSCREVEPRCLINDTGRAL